MSKKPAPKKSRPPGTDFGIPLPGMTRSHSEANIGEISLECYKTSSSASTSSSNSLVLRKFDGTNFTVWKAQAEAYMVTRNCWNAIANPRPKDELAAKAWDDLNTTARAILLLALDDNQGILVCHLRNAKDIWERLAQAHHQSSQAGKISAQRQFYAANMRESENVIAYVSRVQQIYNQILESGIKMEEENLVGRIVAGLTPNWHTFMTNWANNNVKQTMAELLPRLKAEESLVNRGRRQQAPQALFVQKKASEKPTINMKPKANKLSTNNDPKSHLKCNYCKKKRHTEEECRKKKRDKEAETTAIAEALMSETEGPKIPGWIIDSGSTDHMTFDASTFTSYRQFDEPKRIRLGDSGETVSIGCGNILLSSETGQGKIQVILKDVLLVPDLRRKLLSLGKTMESGHRAIAKGKDIVILNQNNKPLIVGIKTINLYEAQIREILPELHNVEQQQVDNDIELWHERLAHVSRKTILKMHKNNSVDGLEKCSFRVDPKSTDRRQVNCEACCLSKHAQAHIPLSSRERATKVGEAVHMDICGPIGTETIAGGRYIVLFKDEFSNYRFCYIVKSREETYNCIRQTFSKIEADTGKRVLKIVSDCGGEMTSNRSKAFFLEKNIVHQTSVPFLPQQNGFIERENRTLLEAIRAMLYHRHLPENLWGEACNAATYLLNRIINKNTKLQTPFERYFGRKPRVTHLRVYGSITFVKTQQKKRSGPKKLEPRSNKLVMVGYDRDFTYRLYDPINNKIILSRDVIFDEKKLPEISIPTVTYQSLESYMDTPEDTENGECDSEDENDTEANIMDLEDPDEPINYEQACKSPDNHLWKKAMDSEYNSLINNDTWSIRPLPSNQKLVQSKWVYKLKPAIGNQPTRHKARLVAKGFTQRRGIDYDETFSPVVRLESIRLILSIVAERDLELVHFDVHTAFLYGNIDKEIWMTQPQGYEKEGQNLACRLNKSIYGLKQASHVWNQTFTKFLLQYKLKPLQSDSCVFISRQSEEILILAVYVDDGLVATSTPQKLTELILKLQTKFDISITEASCYVGLEITRKRSEQLLHVKQTTFATKILSRFNMSDASPVSIPMLPNQKLVKLGTAFGGISNSTNAPYRQAIGSLIYLMNGSRPDIACAVGILSRFCSAPTQAHWEAVKMILRYIGSTLEYGILFNGKEPDLVAYSDSDHAGCLDTRRSISGYVVIKNAAPIIWRSTKQTTTAESSTESEFISCSQASKEIVWIRNFLQELLGKAILPTTLFVDNQSAIKLVRNNQTHSKIKHLDIKMCAVREREGAGIISVKYIPTNKQTADILTKALPSKQFTYLRKILGVMMLILCIKTVQGIKFNFESSLFQDTTIGKVSFKVRNPCAIIHNALSEYIGPVQLSPKYAHQAAWKAITADICEEIYKQRIMKAIDNIAECHHSRNKRTPVTTAINAAYAIATVVIGVTNLIRGASNQVSGSTDNLLGLVSQLNQSTIATLTDRNVMSQEGLQGLAVVSPSSHAHQFQVQEELFNQPMFTWITFKAINEMYAGAASLNAVAEHCRNDQLATVEISELVEQDALVKIQPESTKIISVQVDRDEKRITFVYSIERSIMINIETLIALILATLLGIMLAKMIRSQSKMAKILNHVSQSSAMNEPRIIELRDDSSEFSHIYQKPLEITGL